MHRVLRPTNGRLLGVRNKKVLLSRWLMKYSQRLTSRLTPVISCLGLRAQVKEQNNQWRHGIINAPCNEFGVFCTCFISLIFHSWFHRILKSVRKLVEVEVFVQLVGFSFSKNFTLQWRERRRFLTYINKSVRHVWCNVQALCVCVCVCVCVWIIILI